MNCKSNNPFLLTSPCNSCPFRKDIPAYLSPERVREIRTSLIRSSFPCHKTLIYKDQDGDGNDITDNSMASHCAGALILLEKEEIPSQMMRIGERLGLYDARKLNMEAPVYDTFEEMIDAQSYVRGKKKKRK